MPPIRIQKLLSDAGVASRRAVEQMILDGRITVNGELIGELPCFVDPTKDDIVVDGRSVAKRQARKVYLLLNKPRGVVCTETDLMGRPTVFEIIPQRGPRMLCVGTLDAESSGLVLLTNDGELVEQLTRRSTPIVRKYVAEVEGRLDEQAVSDLRRGFYLDGRRTRGAFVKVLSRSPERSLLEIDLIETVNREVRRTLARIAHKVRRLKRVAFGKLTDSGLKIGSWRELAPHEIRALQAGQGGELGQDLRGRVREERTETRPGRRPGRGTRQGGRSTTAGAGHTTGKGTSRTGSQTRTTGIGRTGKGTGTTGSQSRSTGRTGNQSRSTGRPGGSQPRSNDRSKRRPKRDQ